MKNIALFFTLIFLTLLGNAQEKSEIIPLMEKMVEKSIQKDYNAVMDLSYPKIFEIAEREQMIEMFVSVMDNDDFKIKILPTNHNFEVSDIKNIDGGKYALVSYNTRMSLNFKNMENINPVEVEPLLKAGFPGSKIQFNKETQSFDVMIRSKDLAISDEYTDGKWKFLNAGEGDKEMMKLLIDEKIINAFEL